MAIDERNRLASLEREEAREVRRSLTELTENVRPLHTELTTAFEVLAEADSLQARARYALEHGGVRPDLEDASQSTGLRIVDGIHPLLLATGESAVPFSVSLDASESVLLISGPNAGGKTVTLKAVGLLAAMAQSGVIPPVARGTSLPVFDAFYAVIGDEQSISASLSTFSAQMDTVRQILEHAGPASLVVLDEIGGNTDPAEGAALAAAILLHLSGRVALTVATTHLGELKDLAVEEPAIVNASLQFDAEALRPSFALVRDRPGRSYAFEIASRLGLPAALLDVARQRVSRDNRRMEEVLKRLELDESEISRMAGQSRVESRKLAEKERAMEERYAALAERERAVEREARERADRYLLEARRDVEAVIEGLTAEGAGVDPESSRSARQEVERLLRANRDQAGATGDEPVTADAPAVRPEPGDFVRSRSLGVTGQVTEVSSLEVTVESRGVRITLPRADLVIAPSPPRDLGPVTRGGVELPEIVPRPEVDLRGLRVDEIEGPLLSAVDAAYVADLGRLLVIHGTGTGALRKEVTRLLGGDPRIASLERGGFEEGGFGVTVVRLKGGAI
jgi:DNA mismatch repair protein MutS2